MAMIIYSMLLYQVSGFPWNTELLSFPILSQRDVQNNEYIKTKEAHAATRGDDRIE